MVVRPASGAGTLARPAALRAWLPALIAIALAALVFGFAFRVEVAGAVAVWIGSTAYNHCFLVLPLVGFLIWERRSALAPPPRPAPWALLLLPPLAALWLAAAMLDILEGRQLAMMAMFEVVLLAVLGLSLFRRLLAPLLFLFFLVPSGGFLVPSLQAITARFAVAGLHVLHIPVYSDGFMIQIPEGVFEIAEACAGLRFLIAAIVFGCFFAVVMYRSWWRRAAFIALSCTVPIAANGMRALGILVLARILGSATAAETDHILYGWIFFTIVILVLIAIGMSFAERDAAPAPVAAADIPAPPARRWRIALVALGAIVLAVAGPAYAGWLDAGAPRLALAAVRPPSVAPPWQARDTAAAGEPAWRPAVAGADRVFFGTYAAPGGPAVTRFVALYRLRAVGNRLTASDNRLADGHQWRLVRREPVATMIAGHRAPVTAALLMDGPYRRIVWSFFVVDGRITDRALTAKLLQARAVLLRRTPLAAFVAISAAIEDTPARTAAALSRFLAAGQALPAYLAEAAGRRG